MNRSIRHWLKGPKPKPLTERFFSKVELIPFHTCWEWTGGKYKNGYGHLLYKHQTWNAHRLSWVIHYGEIPSGKHVLHRCDNRSCVNPAHLFLGTHRENMEDMTVKGRRHKPQKHLLCSRGHAKRFNGKRLVCDPCTQLNYRRRRALKGE